MLCFRYCTHGSQQALKRHMCERSGNTSSKMICPSTFNFILLSVTQTVGLVSLDNIYSTVWAAWAVLHSNNSSVPDVGCGHTTRGTLITTRAPVQTCTQSHKRKTAFCLIIDVLFLHIGLATGLEKNVCPWRCHVCKLTCEAFHGK